VAASPQVTLPLESTSTRAAVSGVLRVNTTTCKRFLLKATTITFQRRILAQLGYRTQESNRDLILWRWHRYFLLWHLWHFSLKVVTVVPQSLPQVPESANPVPPKRRF